MIIQGIAVFNSIKSRLLGLVLIFAVGFVSLSAYTVQSYKNNIFADTNDRLSLLVASAYSVVADYQAKSTTGELSEQDAKARALAALRVMRYGPSGYFWIHDMDMRVVMHPLKPEWEGQIKSDVKQPDGTPLYGAMNDAIRNNGGEDAFYSYTWPKPGEDKATLFPKTSYIKYFKPWNMVIGTGVYVDELEAQVWSLAIWVGAICVIALGLLIVVSLLIVRSISNPLEAIVVALNRLARGDTSQTNASASKLKEIVAINATIVSFRDAIDERVQLGQSAAADQQARAGRQQKVDNLIVAFRQGMTNALNTFSQSAGKMLSASEQLKGTSNAASARAASAASAAQSATHSVQVVAASAEELAASIGEIGRQIQTTNKIVDRAADAARHTNSRIDSLAEAATKIGAVVNLISEIAEQTNLLALNATIEAARAGEAGRGFAVVASEVKQLANQTAKATEEIAVQVNDIQGATGEAVGAIRQISAIMEEINGNTNAIASAISQQSAATDEISRSVADASDGTQNATGEIDAVSKGVADTSVFAADVAATAEDMNEETRALRHQVESFLSQVAAA
ncbi:methyl-accepting chemotaxis protein [Oryzibacter oryziterrae]|uniref:methyl-accepting chemotaxis protein n=1 Tax=Oryzibacter oryziterrae TaxID=2766474 RepID=UPI001F26233A|nr:cache domain-containing protein [Oryzibacter oryziterrae]